MPERSIITPFDAITYKIIGCAMAVHRQLGSGLREDSYQKALGNYFSDSSLAYEAEKLYEVHDDPEQHRLVGYWWPGFVHPALGFSFIYPCYQRPTSSDHLLNPGLPFEIPLFLAFRGFLGDFIA